MKNTDILIFAKNLKKYRNLRKYSQEKLGSLVGITKTTIYSYEKGTNIPNIDILNKICQELMITPNDLLLEKNTSIFSTNDIENTYDVTKQEIATNLIQCINIDKYFTYRFEDKKDLIHPSTINHVFSLDIADPDIVGLVAFYIEEKKNNKIEYVKKTKKKLDEINHPVKDKSYYGFDEEY